MQGNGRQKFVPTEEQRQAIEHVSGPMLVVAGAGTGKTTVLARRIAHLINSEIAKPNEILAVTYTRNAAAELIERVAKLLHPNLSSQKAASKLMASGLEATTFHAYCHGLLQRNGVKFDLIDEKDVQVYLRRRIAELNLKYFVESANLGKFLRDLLEFFDRCQDELRTPDDYDAYLARVARGEIPLPRVAKSKKAETMARRGGAGPLPRNCPRLPPARRHAAAGWSGYLRAHHHARRRPARPRAILCCSGRANGHALS